jgi:hypothetical protein
MYVHVVLWQEFRAVVLLLGSWVQNDLCAYKGVFYQVQQTQRLWSSPAALHSCSSVLAGPPRLDIGSCRPPTKTIKTKSLYYITTKTIQLMRKSKTYICWVIMQYLCIKLLNSVQFVTISRLAHKLQRCLDNARRVFYLISGYCVPPLSPPPHPQKNFL